MKVAVITGASSGLGREFAVQIAKRYRTIEKIILVARRKDELETTAGLVQAAGGTAQIVPMDVTKEEERARLVQEIQSANDCVRMLVNCAGYGVMGSFTELTAEDNEGMIRLNCEALTAITYALLPSLTKNANIINVASAAAFVPQPQFAVYAASKAYVLSFSKALNRELKTSHITVTAVCPGPVKTAFFDTAEKYHKSAWQKKLLVANPANVVALALRDAYHRKNCSVYGGSMKAARLLAKFVPQEVLMYFFD